MVDIDYLLLVKVENFWQKPNIGVNPDEVVAVGAAVQAVFARRC